MEIIIPFKKTDFANYGTHIVSGKFIYDLQHEWEKSFHNQFNPLYANVLEGHPMAMKRLTIWKVAANRITISGWN
jgi:hypothetical protein